MASFDFPPLTPDPDPAPLSPTIPLNPPMVGEASPFDHVDGQNRDLILESIRSWVRHNLRAWTTEWQEYLVYWLALVADYLNGFVEAADAYITEHAISGYSWRTTNTTIAPTGTTTVTITGVDDEHRPLIVGDLVSDHSQDIHYGVIVAVIDSTHASVQYIGNLRGLVGFGWWTTITAITHSGTTAVVLSAVSDRTPQLNDLVVDSSASVAYSKVIAVADATHVTVAYIGTMQGPQGIQGIQGIQGEPGDPGVVQSIVAGAFITVDATDPANPIVTGSAGGGGVDSVVAGDNITVDSTDPANPIVAGTAVVESVVAGTNVTVDSTDPANPIVSATGGGGGGSTVFATQTLLFAGPTTVGETYTVSNAPGLTWTALADDGWAISGVLQVVNSDDTSSLFDSDFYSNYFNIDGDGNGNVLYVHHSYSDITYKWIDFNNPSSDGFGIPWDSDWINAPSNITAGGFVLATGKLVGMLKFSAGRLQFRGILTVSADTVLGTDLAFQLAAGLLSSASNNLPVPFSLLGDVYATDADQSWRGEVMNAIQDGPTADYYLFIPDLADSENFTGDIWAGRADGTVNHEWAAGSTFEWVIDVPIDPFATTYNDGRSQGGDGGEPGDFPVGGGPRGSGIDYPRNIVDDTSQVIPDDNPRLSGWDVSYGVLDYPIYTPDMHTIIGAIFDDTGHRITADIDEALPTTGFTPTLHQAVRFVGISGTTGIVEGTTYYIGATGPGAHDFDISVNPDGTGPVAWSGDGTADQFTLVNAPGGTTITKGNQYDAISFLPIPISGHYLPTTAVPNWLVWANYSF